jgi:hypothetical protein
MIFSFSEVNSLMDSVHFLAERSDIARTLDNPLTTVMVLVEFITKVVERIENWIIDICGIGRSLCYMLDFCSRHFPSCEVLGTAVKLRVESIKHWKLRQQ